MNLGDGLLFELENGKPRLIILSRATEKNPVKQFSFRSRAAAAAVLSCRQPSSLEPLLPPAGKHRRGGGGGGGGGGANTNTSTVTNKNPDQRKQATKTVSKRSKLKTTKGDSTAATLRANENAGRPESAATPLADGTGVTNVAANRDAGQEEHVATLTNEQQILHSCRSEGLGAEPGVGGATGIEKTGSERGEPTITTSSNDDRGVGLFGLMEERHTQSRAALEAKKAEWRRDLDAQVAFKHLQQQRSNRLQADDDTHCVLSAQSCKELPAAIRSNLRLGTFTPTEDQQPVARREEQRRIWLEELDRQRGERRTQAPPPAGSSLPLLGEGAGTGAESRTSYLRTMTSLLDPAQVEERERRRRKQMEQQRAIEAQMEERRRQREWEESERRRKQEEEERRVEVEREELQRKQEQEAELHRRREEAELHRRREEEEELQRLQQMDVLKERQKSQRLEVDHEEQRLQENKENKENKENQENQTESHRDSAVQTDDPPSERRKGRDPCERSRGNQRRPEWNMQRPSRRFVPASERYPITLQKNRQQSRQRRQAELLALQGRSCLSRAELHPQDSAPSSSKEEAGPTGVKTSNRGRSAMAAAGHTPALGFVPYVRTDEVFNLDPLEPAETPPPPPPSGAPPPTTHTHRQQEILRGLAQLRQGLLLRQRELESDLSLHPP